MGAEKEKVLILGAAGRDFHNFNTVYREQCCGPRVVAFTATQIPRIDGRRYPASLAGASYPEGIPILPEQEMEQIIRREGITQVVLAYSDLSHARVMELASRALSAGADFSLLGPERTFIRSRVPVIAVCAVRTGCGKSQTSRYVASVLRNAKLRTVAIRHPMPYGDLEKQAVQRLASYEDLDRAECTIEEREEYESHIDCGTVVYAGVDYQRIVEQAEQEADVIIWDGGNNDIPFIRPDLWITVADPFRAEHGRTYYPGAVNLRAADVVVLNKATDAPPERVEATARIIAEDNPRATVVRAASSVSMADAAAVRGKRVLLIEDGPTLTHGEMSFGVAKVAADRFGAAEIVDPRPYATGSIQAVYQKYPHLGAVLPAMGYYAEQVAELEETIRNTPCDLVLVGTPFDLPRLLHVDKPCQRVGYELTDLGEPTLRTLLQDFLHRLQARKAPSAAVPL